MKPIRFGSLNRLVSQPLPLSSRDTKKLLQAITSSFRKNLDREHGFLPAPEDDPPSHGPAPAPKNRPRRHHHHRPIDAHLHAILSNPLVGHSSGPASDGSPALDSPPAGMASTTPPTPIAPPSHFLPTPAMRLPVRDPVDFFDAAVARGVMTVPAAAGCMRRLVHMHADAPPGQRTASLASAGLASRVLLWLRSSGREPDMAFLSRRTLVNDLVLLMVAEGLEEVAWTWLERATAMPDGAGLGAAASLVQSLVSARDPLSAGSGSGGGVGSGGGASADAQIMPLVRADDMFGARPRFADAISAPWSRLSWLLSGVPIRLPPSAPVFDAFLDLARRHFAPASRALDMAHLSLYHPTRPDHGPAVELLTRRRHHHHRHRDDPPQSPDTAAAEPPAAVRRPGRLALIAMDTVQYLMRMGRYGDADQLQKMVGFHRAPAAAAAAFDRPGGIG